MHSVLFQNVRVMDQHSSWNGQQADVLVADGHIQKIAAARTLSHPTGLTLQGGVLSPGWVDLRCQLSDPGFEQREDLSSLAAAALAGGFTTIVTQPNSDPVQDNAGQIRALLQRAAALPIHLHPMAALSAGAAGKDLAELYEMHHAGAVAFTDGRKGTQHTALLLRSLQYVQPFGGLIVQSPIDQGLADGELVAEGLSAVKMGMKGIPALAETICIERDLRLLEHAGGKLHIGPVTTAEGVALVRAAKARGLDVTAETSALYLLLDAVENESFDPTTKVYPPLRDRAAVLALRAAVVDGTIDVVSSSHHPQGREEKMHDFADAAFGASSLETAFSAAHTAMASLATGLEALIAALTERPRGRLQLPAATIAEGTTAELTYFDPQQDWTPQAADIRSKSKYNPLLGRDLKGRVIGTYVKGSYHPASTAAQS
jgi:dihydroorotase